MSIFRLNGCPYQIGDVCIRTTSVSPSTTWPGTTWTEIAQGRVLVGADSSHAAKATGDPTHTHGMQSHTHDMQSHTHGMQSHTHGMQSHTHTYGIKYAATWRTLVTLANADGDSALIEPTGLTGTTTTRSEWNHQCNNAIQTSSKTLNPVIVTKSAKTGGPSNNTTTGPNNNTTTGPNNNTTTGPSNNTTTASSCMPPWYGVHYWLRTA